MCVFGLVKLVWRRKAEPNRASISCEAPGDGTGNTGMLKYICYDFSNETETLGFNEDEDISVLFLQLLLGQKKENGMSCSISILNKI